MKTAAPAACAAELILLKSKLERGERRADERYPYPLAQRADLCLLQTNEHLVVWVVDVSAGGVSTTSTSKRAAQCIS